jgi:hypothetical protein
MRKMFFYCRALNILDISSFVINSDDIFDIFKELPNKCKIIIKKNHNIRLDSVDYCTVKYVNN